MQLRITTPTRLLVDRAVTAVEAEDASGRFGIRPGHEPLLTALIPSILVFRESEVKDERYVAVRGGVLRVTQEGVQVATRDAYLSEDLTRIKEEVREARQRRMRGSHRAVRSFYQMQLSAWRRLVEYQDERR